MAEEISPSISVTPQTPERGFNQFPVRTMKEPDGRIPQQDLNGRTALRHGCGNMDRGVSGDKASWHTFMAGDQIDLYNFL